MLFLTLARKNCVTNKQQKFLCLPVNGMLGSKMNNIIYEQHLNYKIHLIYYILNSY